ncbi:MAG TPA: hypothetical protein VLE44_01940 [Candidatus Saccharimonadales bacterium]|nr:hypothetical protein [Candidatus Saccharimonadales bacterium]
MRISTPRREIQKQRIKELIVASPKINNSGLANEIGVHRNTIPKLLNEIQRENEEAMNKRWKMLLNDVTGIADERITQLNKLWIDAYWAGAHSRPSQLVSISKMNWTILKDLYRFHLEYMGIRENPKSLIQINIDKETDSKMYN